MGRKKKVEYVTYKCVCCGEEKREENFYTSRHSKMWKASNGKVLLCKVCANKIFEEYKQTNTEDESLLGMCSLLDIPYYKNLAMGFKEKGQNVELGRYIAFSNGTQYKTKNFLDSMLDSEFIKSEDAIREQREITWRREDKRNKNHVLSVVGYDPFEDQEMTEADRKYCYNVLSGYCDLEGVQDDQYKLDSVIQMTNLQLQSHKIDAQINKEQNKPNPDESKLKELAISQEKKITSITRLSKDNNIGSQYNTMNNGSTNTFSGKIKEMTDEKLNESKVNLFDIKTSKAMQQISDINMQSILDKLNLETDDYSKMIGTMRQEREEKEKVIDELKEENRELKNKIESLIN